MAADDSVPVQLDFSLDLTTDPLGADLSVVVTDAPNEDSREALLDSMERSLVGARGNLVFQAIEQAHDQLEQYGSSNDYDTEPIIDSLSGVEADRGDDRIDVSWSWTHEAAHYHEFGTSDHHIDGDPVLSFVWDDPPGWVREEFDRSRSSGGQFQSGWRVFLPGVDVDGLPESRFVRDSLNWFRQEVGQ